MKRQKKRPWLNYGEALSYLCAHYPLERGPGAAHFVDGKIEDGTFPTRYLDRDIEQGEWRRDERGVLIVEGLDIAASSVEFKRAAIEATCAPPPGRGGRPHKYDYEGMLIHLAQLVYNDRAYSAASIDDLVDAGSEWMKEHHNDGGPSDNRDIRKRCARFHEEVLSED